VTVTINFTIIFFLLFCISVTVTVNYINTAPLTVDWKPVLHPGHGDTEAVIVFFFLLHVVCRTDTDFPVSDEHSSIQCYFRFWSFTGSF